MISIGIIAPDAHVYAAGLRLAEDLGLAGAVEIHEAVLEDALPLARSMAARGVDVIVSRGATVERIESSGLRVPVVNVPLSIHDISAMLGQAKELTGLDRPRIGVITYTRIDLDLKALAALLDADLHAYHTLSSKESIEKATSAAIADGMDVLVGGISTFRAMQGISGHTVRFARYVSSDASIRQALLEAKQIAQARKLEQQRAEQFKAVVESSRDGIVAVDADGRVTMANPEAVRMLRLPKDPVGTLFVEACPVPECIARLKAGRSVSDELAHRSGQPLLFSLTPIRVRGTATGAVITCRRARDIVELEAKIRTNLASRGLVARHSFADIVGESPQIRAAVSRARKYARADDTVLLTGRTGTGKEVFAQAIHNAGPRKHGPFVAVNCAALPPTLLESALFG